MTELPTTATPFRPRRCNAWRSSTRATGPAFDRYLSAIVRDKKQTTNLIFDPHAPLSHDIGYLIRMELAIQTPDETLC